MIILDGENCDYLQCGGAGPGILLNSKNGQNGDGSLKNKSMVTWGER